jgi:tRNA A37 threonylcarbamoyltransferase TsaD
MPILLDDLSDNGLSIQVDFPFLVLLISGGHCLLAVVQAVDKFLLLGKSLDDAPGEAFDKVTIICRYLQQRYNFVLRTRIIDILNYA